jgi:predicted MFS family arabinose efflux permease
VRERAYQHYLLTVLLLVLAFNYVDRLAFGLVLQDIKLDLGLTDTQLGLLSGIAFALFYSVMGIPLARWADRGNRITLITVTTSLWSAAVALCGIASSFIHLLLIRIGVAVGEAGCIPPAHSLIADHFPRAERPRAVSIYMLGKPLSMVIGYFFAGWLNEIYGWRVTFMLLGVPGLALAALVWLTLREPRRKTPAPRLDTATASSVSQPAMTDVFRTLWSCVTFRHLLVGFSISMFFNYGIGQWQPAFFIRSHGLETGELGTAFALIWGGGGLLGTYLGGALASRYAAGNEQLQLKGAGVMFGLFAITFVLIYLTRNLYVAFVLMGLAAVGSYTINGPFFATMQTLVPARMRGVSIAIIYLFANLIGMGLGPVAAGALSDALRAWAGEESLRYALLALSPGYLWAGWHLWMAGQTVTRDLARS